MKIDKEALFAIMRKYDRPNVHYKHEQSLLDRMELTAIAIIRECERSKNKELELK